MKINLVRQNFGFVPAEDEDMEKSLKIKKGQVVEANFKVYRNYLFHKKFFALIGTAWEFLNEKQQEFFHNSKDGFRYSLTLAAGYYETFYSLSRKEWVQVPKSIAFDKMDEATFDKLYNDVVNLIFKLFLNHVDQDKFYNALKDF